MIRRALFRFEASPEIGAGHAIRSCVIADELVAYGWNCQIITSQNTYNFIKDLSRFSRIDPDQFESFPETCDLLVIDSYDADYLYERRFRPFAKTIMVIDDLANRRHDCDILLDQTYGRLEEDYLPLVPANCKLLLGIDYVLLRKEIRDLRQKALEKRRNTSEVKRILVSMGGSDPNNHTLRALEMIQKSGFQGEIDVVLGFSSQNMEIVTQFVDQLSNKVTIHTNANMAQLMYDADFCIGASGSSVWERLYLGLPSVLIQTADNQELIYKNLTNNQDFPIFDSLNSLTNKISINFEELSDRCFQINFILDRL